MEMKYSDNGTLFPSFTAVLTDEPLRTEHKLTTFSV